MKSQELDIFQDTFLHCAFLSHYCPRMLFGLLLPSFFPPDAIRHVCPFLQDSIPLPTLCIFVASLRQSPASSIHEQPFSVHYVQIVFEHRLLLLAPRDVATIGRVRDIR